MLQLRSPGQTSRRDLARGPHWDFRRPPGPP